MKSLPRVLPIAKEEAARAGYTLDELLADDHSKRITFVRHLAMWRARTETGRTWFEIGRVFQRDRTTVLHAFKKIDAMPIEQRAEIPSEVRRKKDHKPRKKARTFLGKPCPNGHEGVRYWLSGRCVECVKVMSHRQYLARKERRNEI